MTSEAARQEKHWNHFYESAWDLRKNFIQGKINEGEKSPLRIIRLLEQHERFNTAMRSPEDGSVTFVENPSLDAQTLCNLIFDENMDCRISDYRALPTGLPAVEKCTFGDRYHMQCVYSETNKMAFIMDFMRNKKIDAIIELGSGFSQNLFKLYYEGGPDIPYYGGEYTTSGTDCADLLASLLPELKLTNFNYDFNSPNYSAIGEFENVLVFTCHTIEQVEVLSDKTLSSIAKIAKNVHCIHFEPFGYQLVQPGSEVDGPHKAAFHGRRWNTNLLRRLLAAHKNREIELTFVGKNIMGSYDSGTNPTSLAVWNNAPSGGDDRAIGS